MDRNGRSTEQTERIKPIAIIVIACALFLTLTISPGWATEPTGTKAGDLEVCPTGVDLKGTSRPLFKATALMAVVTELEGQGESNFRPAFDPPKSQCRLDEFTVGTTRVSTVYSPWEKGLHTLHYRFVTDDGVSPRELLVIYDGVTGFTFNIGQFFYIVETRGGETSYYAMFGEKPGHTAVKEIVTDVLSGKAEPLASVRWPTGAKEPEITKYDSKRLKK